MQIRGDLNLSNWPPQEIGTRAVLTTFEQKLKGPSAITKQNLSLIYFSV